MTKIHLLLLRVSGKIRRGLISLTSYNEILGEFAFQLLHGEDSIKIRRQRGSRSTLRGQGSPERRLPPTCNDSLSTESYVKQLAPVPSRHCSQLCCNFLHILCLHFDISLALKASG